MKTWLRIFIIGCFALLALTVHAKQSQPLPINQAFQFTAMAKDYQTVVLNWKIAPGYYLYRDKFKIRAVKPGKMKLTEPVLPYDSVEKSIPSVGKLDVYDADMYIIQPILNSNSHNITLQVHYQGCSQHGYCYPPITEVVSINLANNYDTPVQGVLMDIPPEVKHGSAPPTSQVINPQDKITAILTTDNLWGIIIGFFVFGVLLSFTPCVLPMIPILSSIIVGQGKISHTRSFFLSLAYVLGMAITYAIAGIIFGFIGGSVQAAFQKPWLIIVFTIIFIAMALSLFGLYNLQLPSSWRAKIARTSDHQKHGTLIGTFVMGILATLILSPCVTPPLVGVLAYISQTGNAIIGGVALLCMGIGMGLPLLLIGAFGPKLIPHTGKWMVAVKNFMGVLLLAVAIWMLSRLLPDNIILLLWGLLVIGSGVALGALTTAKGHLAHWRKAIAVALFIYGIVLCVGAFLGNSNPLQPLAHQRNRVMQELHFIPVKNVDDIYKHMHNAGNKPILLDFYADWCVACKEMDHITFSDPKVKQALKHFVLLRANVTKNSLEDKIMQKHFSVVAPPTILFFGKDHKEIKSTRIIGMIKPQPFLNRLKKVSRK